MKKKLVIGIVVLFAICLFLEGQYHFFLRSNRYWANTGVFSTDGRIQSVGSNNTLRAAYSPGVYGDISCASDNTLDISNMGKVAFRERAVANRGEGTYLFANMLAVGGYDDNHPTLPGDSQGIKMEFDWGLSTTGILTGSGKNVHGLDIKMLMDEIWDFTSGDRNATVRGARLQGWTEEDVGCRVMGLYANARADKSGTNAIEIKGVIGSAEADPGPGLVSIEARTEIGASETLTTPAVVGVLVYHNSKSLGALVGDYRAIQICQPNLPSHSGGSKYGIWFGDDNNTAYPFDYAFGFSSELNIDQVANLDTGSTNADVNDATDVDGWIKVDMEGTPLYIYLWVTKPES